MFPEELLPARQETNPGSHLIISSCHDGGVWVGVANLQFSSVCALFAGLVAD